MKIPAHLMAQFLDIAANKLLDAPPETEVEAPREVGYWLLGVFGDGEEQPVSWAHYELNAFIRGDEDDSADTPEKA